jgi:hypothetical protein
MAFVMSYKVWKETTKRTARRRSKDLKVLDGSIARFHNTPTEDNRKDISIALEAWKTTKGFPGWESSGRNHKGAVTVLSGQMLFGQELKDVLAKALIAELPYGGIERAAQLADLEARDIIRRQRLEAVRRLFSYDGQPRKMKPKVLHNIKTARTLNKQKNAAKQATQAAKEVASGTLKAETMKWAKDALRGVVEELPEMVPEAISAVVSMVEDLLTEICPDLMMEIAAAAVPVLPIARSGLKFGKHSVSAISLKVKQLDATKHEFSFQPGNPEVAAEAITRILKRKANSEARLATIYGTDTAARGAALALDAAAMGAASTAVGAVSGAATALAKLTNTLFLLSRDVYEMYKANKNLAQIISKNPDTHKPALDGKLLFGATPILGAFFVANANTSDLVNFLVSDMGQPGWKYDIEVLIDKHISKMTKYARSLISASRFEMSGMEYMKGQTKNISNITKKEGKWEHRLHIDRKAKRMARKLEAQAKAKIRQIGPEKLTRWAENREQKIGRQGTQNDKLAEQQRGRYGGASNADAKRWAG